MSLLTQLTAIRLTLKRGVCDCCGRGNLRSLIEVRRAFNETSIYCRDCLMKKGKTSKQLAEEIRAETVRIKVLVAKTIMAEHGGDV